MSKMRRCIAGIALAMSAAAHAAEREYSFGVLNQRNPTLTAQYWNPILQYVSRQSGVPLRLKMGRSAQETSAMTGRGEFDFLYSNHIFTAENRKAGYRVFARPNEKSLRGQLVVLETSEIRGLAELEGRDVAFPNPSAFLGYFVPMDALLRAGIKVKPLFSVNQEGAMGQLKAGRVIAAGVNSEVMQDFAAREGVRYRVLWTSPEYLSLPLSAHPAISSDMVVAVRQAFIRIGSDPEGAAILRASSELLKQPPPSGFVAAGDREYQNIVDFYRTALVKEH